MIHNPVVMDITVSGSDPVLQSKSVSPSESKQTVTPDVGYDGLSSVSVSAIQTETKTVTTNGTVTPSSGKYLKQVTVNVPTSSSPVLQTKSVTPSESSQNVTPDAGYDGLSKVTVGAIQTETKTVTANGTVTPSSGKYLKQVTVNVPTSGGGIDTSDATATADDIAKGKTAYINGEKVTGSIILVDGFNFNSTASWDSQNSKLMLSDTNPKKCIFLANGSIKMYCTGENLGDATVADVAQGKTFTSAAGLKVTGTHVCSGGGIDTSDATATASDIAAGVTAYVNGEKVTGGVDVTNAFNLTPILEKTVTRLSDTRIRIDVATTKTTRTILEPQSTIRIGIDSDVIGGDATTSDVAKGKTFTSAAGFNLVGTAEITTPTLQTKTVTPSASIQTVVPDSGYDGLSSVTVEGDANLLPENIKSGISIFGVTGSYEGSGGSSGSSDNNCEAYHITSASATLNFKTTGTVKVWGYGSKKSNYTTTLYAFVGDGYYAGSSYGTPSKTSATFSIASNGTLSGLPSDLTAVDLLVTIGV